MSESAQQFDGKTYNEKRDHSPLKVQLDNVRSVMFDGQWHTLAELAAHPRIDALATSCSARLRDLRKTKFGSYVIKKRIRAGTKRLWEYKLTIPPGVAP